MTNSIVTIKFQGIPGSRKSTLQNIISQLLSEHKIPHVSTTTDEHIIEVLTKDIGIKHD